VNAGLAEEFKILWRPKPNYAFTRDYMMTKEHLLDDKVNDF